MIVEEIPISILLLDHSNVRQHSPQQIEKLMASLTRFGQQIPLLVRADNSVLAGNARLEAMKRLKWESAKIIRTDLDGVRATEYGIADIAKLTAENAFALAGLEPGQLDCMDMSCPCQGFSSAGKRQFADPRNQLFKDAVRILEAFRPRVLISENVKGQVTGSMKLIFRDTMQAFRDAGFNVAARLLNAKFFGVAQSRERVIVIGVRSDLAAEPSHPTAIGRPLTVREAWSSPTDIRAERGDAVKGPAALIAPHVPPGGSNGGGKYSLPIRGTVAGFGLSRLAWDRPSCTIPKLSLLSSSPLLHPDTPSNSAICRMILEAFANV